MKEIFLWCPYFGNIGTVKAVINTAIALKNQKKVKCFIINSMGEFDGQKNILKKNNINELRFFKKSYINFLPKKGFFFSRLSFVVLFIFNFFPLLFFLKKRKNIVLISYLLTSLPILIFSIFNNQNKLFIRVSGKIHYGYFRKSLFSFSRNKIDKIFFQTKESMRKFQKKFSYDKKKIFILEDPILNLKKINKMKKQKIEKKFNNKKFFVSIGRLTNQKNFLFLIECIKKIVKFEQNFRFLIIGEGEQKQEILKLISESKLEKFVFLLGYKKNVYKYISKSNGLICTSLWEEPGFVIQEAAACKKIILTSDCYSGPSEFLDHSKGGYVFKSNNKSDFIKKFKLLLKTKNLHSNKINKSFKKVHSYTKENFRSNFKKFLN